VRRTEVKDLYAELTVRQTGTADLFSKFTVIHSDTQDLYAAFTVRHSQIRDLKAVFDVGQNSRDLFAEFVVAQFAPAAGLFAEFVVRQETTADLAAEFVIRRSTALDLPAVFVTRFSAARELFAKLVVVNEDSEDLYAVFQAQAVRDLFAEFELQKSVDLFAEFVVKQEKYSTLYAKFTLRQLTSDLFAEFTVRGYGTYDLYSTLYIRHPTWQWTTKRYVEGVISEIPVSDAVLEYTIEGVMVDIQGYLVNNNLSYDWEDITEVPILIKRAATYGVVATLYARGYFDHRVAISIPPRTVTVIPEDRHGGMEYWETKMEYMLALYSSSIPANIIWVDTYDEEPVFTMDDVPPFTEDVFKEYK
jgi:hypothetical protein